MAACIHYLIMAPKGSEISTKIREKICRYPFDRSNSTRLLSSKSRKLVDLFVKWETKIYSRFSFINDMIAENDQLDEEILGVEKEIERVKKQMEEEEKSR